MPLITLKFKDKVLKEYPIQIGETLTIGRNDSNDIVVDNLAVSGSHARIDSVSATFIITDLESTNGTFVNERLISSHSLRNNDIILIGKHELLSIVRIWKHKMLIRMKRQGMTKRCSWIRRNIGN